MSFHRVLMQKSQLSGADRVRAFLKAPSAKDPPGAAYQVPWCAKWGVDGTLQVTNLGDEVLLMVRVFGVGDRALSTLPVRVLPGEVITARFPPEWQDDAVFVRWLRPGRGEFLWPVVR